jgi:ubiquinone biosynthesis protein
MFRTLRNLWRLFTIARVLARHNALFLLDRIGIFRPILAYAHLIARKPEFGRERPGQRLAEALQELGPTFIKLGQALSIRSDLVGEQVAADLSDLQDKLPPFSAKEARRIIEREFERPLHELFSSFDEQPVAAASIAQVHFAVTVDGREVAVKLLRPGVEAAIARDIDLFYWVAEIFERVQPSLRRLKPVESVRTFEESVVLEMDLRFEAAAAAEMAENFAGDPGFRVPAIDWLRTAKRVLTLERVHGISVDEADRLQAAGIDRRQLLEKAADAFFNQVFRDGFFHADMHPGNLFVDASGNLIAVDFGITGRVDKRTRRFLGEMLIGFLTGDYRRVAEIHFEAGYVPADKSIDHFTQACRSIAEPILGLPLHEISIARLLGQLFQVTEQFSMETQPQLLLLQKSMLVAEGVGRTVDPTINMWQLARPLIEQWMIANLGPEARLRNGVTGLRTAMERLPRFMGDVERVANMLSDGGLRLHPDSVKALTRPRRSSVFPTYMPWLLVAVLLVLLVVK